MQRALEQNAVVFADGTDADVIALAEDPLEVAVQIFHVRAGRIRGERGWVADRFEEGGTGELVEQFLLQLYAEPTPTDADAVPREILVPVLPDSLDSLPSCSASAAAPREHPGAAAGRQADADGDRRPERRPGPGPAQDHPGQRPLHPQPGAGGDPGGARAAQRAAADRVLDISNLQGTEVVASMVVFEDGLPRKGEYRRFVIRGVDGQNDVAAMHEVITRRFRRLLDERPAARAPGEAGGEEGPLLVDPVDRRAAQVRLRARRWSWSTAVRRRWPRPQRRWTSWASTTSRCAGWPSGWRRSGCPAWTSR